MFIRLRCSVSSKKSRISARFKKQLCTCSRSAPCFITFLNIASGFAALLAAHVAHIALAKYFLLLAILCDALDGAVARTFNLESRLGKELDSLADAVSFCVAPAFVVLCGAARIEWHLLGAALLYCCCGIYRLARFNVLSETAGRGFLGLPTTAAAFIVCLVLMPNSLSNLYGVNQASFMTILLLFLALSMISHVRVPRTIPVFIRISFFIFGLLFARPAFFIFCISWTIVVLQTLMFARCKQKQVIKQMLH